MPQKIFRKILKKKIIHNQQFISFVQSLGENHGKHAEQIDNFLNYEKFKPKFWNSKYHIFTFLCFL